ncbi:MAG: Stf0 family sulfotransferase [Pseudomonadota bacterium]
MPVYGSYMICTSPRSGSTLLCELLAATGSCGRPRSWFHTPSPARWADVLGLTGDDPTQIPNLRKIFDAARRQGSTGGAIFGLRLQRHSADFLFDTLATLFPEEPSDKARFQRAFGHCLFIHLTREDKIDQAVSLVKAEQSGLWHMASDGSEMERSAPHAYPTYDFAQIDACVRSLRDYEAGWLDWFSREGIEPYRITYSALSRDPKGVVAGLLRVLDVDPDAASGLEIGVKKLADGTNRQWKARYLAEARHLDSAR